MSLSWYHGRHEKCDDKHHMAPDMFINNSESELVRLVSFYDWSLADCCLSLSQWPSSIWKWPLMRSIQFMLPSHRFEVLYPSESAEEPSSDSEGRNEGVWRRATAALTGVAQINVVGVHTIGDISHLNCYDLWGTSVLQFHKETMPKQILLRDA